MKIQNAIAGMLGVMGLVAVASQAHAAIATTTLTGDTLVTSTSYTGVPGKNAAGQTLFVANIYSAVYKTTTGTLDFVYQFQTTAGPSTIKSFSATNFSGFTVSEFLDTTTADQHYAGPYVTSGAAAEDASGTVDYFYTPVIAGGTGDVPAGDSSYLEVVATNATQYTAGTTNLQDGGNLTVATFAPAAVPEPTTVASFGFGGFGLLGLMVRARKARRSIA